MTNQSQLGTHAHCYGLTHFQASNLDILSLLILTKQYHVKLCSNEQVSYLTRKISFMERNFSKSLHDT